MAYAPIALTAPNYRDYGNYWIKAYDAGTTTPRALSLDPQGETLVAKLEINQDGFIVTAGGAIVIPYVYGVFDLWMFPTEAEADANDTSSAIRLADDIESTQNGTGGSYIGENPPAFPDTGDRWTRCTDMKGFIWYVDADGGQWVEDRPSYDIAGDGVLAFDTLDDAINSVDIFEGAALNLKERSAGNGGGAMWDVVEASTVTPNTYNIVQCVSVSTLALVLRSAETTPLTAGWVGGINGVEDIRLMLELGISFRTPKNILSLNGIGAKWAAGLKSPVVIFGDSTTDGRVSTTNGVDEMTQYNITSLVGENVPTGFNRDHDESEAPNCYVSVLQRMCRDIYDNAILRVYNSGWRGKSIVTNWAENNIYNAVYANPAYADAEMIGINFGINDSNTLNGEALRLSTYINTKSLILDAYARGVQPFLMTTNASTETSDTGGDYSENFEVCSIIDAVKRSLCKEFGIELVDMSKFMYEFVTGNKKYKTDTLLPDSIHGSDIMHLKQAEFLLTKYIANDIIFKAKDNTVVDGKHPAAKFPLSAQWFDVVQYPISNAGGSNVARPFKVTNTFVNSGVLEQNLIDLWVWCDEPTEIYYNHLYSGFSNPSLAASVATLPQLEVSSNNYSASIHKDYKYDSQLPCLIGDQQGLGILVTTNIGPVECGIGLLDYGLNRVKIRFDPGAAADFINWSGNNVRFGYFTFSKMSQKTKARSLTRNTTTAPKNWQPIDQAPMMYTSYQNGTNRFTELTTNPASSSAYAIRKVGDFVDVAFRMDENMPTRSGYIIAHGVVTVDNTSVSIPNSAVNKTNGWNLALYRQDGDALYLAITCGSDFQFGVPMGSALFSDISGRGVFIRIICDTQTSGKVQLFIDNSVAAECLLTASEISLLACGYVGGVWNDFEENPNAQFMLDNMSFSESL